MKSNSFCVCSFELTRKSFSVHFDILNCTNCGSSHFVAKASGNIVAPEFQYGSRNKKYTERSYLFGKQLRWAHRVLLKQDWLGRKVLEIGCFNGFFLAELQKLGADVYGFDVNQEAIAVGSDLFKLTGRLNISLEHLARQGPFDDIFCIDVLEHLDQPSNFLNEAHTLLKPGGRVIVASPTVERRFHDKSDFPPHHKWWFSMSGLIALLRLHDFEITSIAIQRDGMLFIRNLVGRVLSGWHRREFYGEAFATPQIDSTGYRFFYITLSTFGAALFTLLRIPYCSTIFIATKRYNQ